MLVSRRGALSSAHLDMIRGVAALAVFAGHMRAVFFADYASVLAKSLPVKLLYFLTGFGHQAVIVFFVLSGYFISSSVIRSVLEGRWSWKVYALNRLTRLYIVLLPALLLCAFWDQFGMALSGLAGIYGSVEQYQAIIVRPVPETSGPLHFLGNLLFLQEVAPLGLARPPIAPFSSNGPLWSLSYEFWYYVLFPLLFIAIVPATAGRTRLAYLLAAALILAGIGPAIGLYFLVWLMGVGVGLARPASRGLARAIGAASLLLFLGAMAGARAGAIGSAMAGDLLIGLGFAGTMYLILNTGEGKPSHLYGRVANELAGSSYTLYLVHLPFVVFLNSVIIGQGTRWQPDPAHLAGACAVGAGVLTYSLWVARLTEARTSQFRDRVAAVLLKRPAARA